MPFSTNGSGYIGSPEWEEKREEARDFMRELEERDYSTLCPDCFPGEGGGELCHHHQRALVQLQRQCREMEQWYEEHKDDEWKKFLGLL